MYAIELIRFLLRPPYGKIRALNSPFDKEMFSLKEIRRWVRQGKAEVVEGVLVFNNDLVQTVTRQYEREAEKKQADERYETMVDYENSGKRTTAPSIGQWRSRPTGKRVMPGGPEDRAMQMKRIWPPGSFPEEKD